MTNTAREGVSLRCAELEKKPFDLHSKHLLRCNSPPSKSTSDNYDLSFPPYGIFSDGISRRACTFSSRFYPLRGRTGVLFQSMMSLFEDREKICSIRCQWNITFRMNAKFLIDTLPIGAYSCSRDMQLLGDGLLIVSAADQV